MGILGYTDGPDCHKGPKKWKRDAEEKLQGDVRKAQAATAGSEDDEGPRSFGGWAALEAGKQGNGLPLQSPESMQPYQHLGFSPGDETMWTSDLQNCELVNFYCFNPPNFGYLCGNNRKLICH